MPQDSSENEVVLIIDPNISAIPIQKSNEAMIDLREQSEILFGPSPEIPDNLDYTKLRSTVYYKLHMMLIIVINNQFQRWLMWY